MSQITEIFAEDRLELTAYVNRWPRAKTLTECHLLITYEVLAAHHSDSPRLIGEWFQTFWEALPDNPGIHSEGFGAVCDIAEMYCFGEEE